MVIIEQFIKGKSHNEGLCEDAFFYNDSFIVVADGVTAKTNTLFNGETGGRVAARMVCEAVSELRPETDVFEAVEIMTEKVGSLYGANTEASSAAVSVIIYSKYRGEIWSIGDCQCIINGKAFLHEKEIDRIVSDMRSLVLEIARREGASQDELMLNDIGREFVLPILSKQKCFINSGGKFSYGVIDGSKVQPKDIEVHKVSSGDEVVLASDGYPVLCATLRESEEKLENELKINPLCDGEYRSTKGLQKNCVSFDDRTYIRFRVD